MSSLILLPLYRLSFSIPFAARRSLQESRILSQDLSWKKQIYPTLDDLSMLENVLSDFIYEHLAKALSENNDDTLHGLSLNGVKNEIGATRLEERSKAEELQIDFNTTLAFDSSSVTPSFALVQRLFNTVETFFVNETILQDFEKKLQIESAKLHSEDVGFFSIALAISWTSLDTSDDNLSKIEVPMSNSDSNKPSVFWVFLYLLVLSILLFVTIIALLLRRRSKKKKSSWTKRSINMDNGMNRIEGSTILFSETEVEKNTTRDDRYAPQHITVAESEIVSPFLSSSLRWPLDRIVYDEDTATINNCINSKMQRTSSSPRTESSSNDEWTEDDDDDLDSVLNDDLGSVNDTSVISRASSLAQLQTELAEAKLEHVTLEYKLDVATNRAFRQSDLKRKSINHCKAKEEKEQEINDALAAPVLPERMRRWWDSQCESDSNTH